MNLRKTARLEWIFFKLSAIADLNMRFNLFTQFLNDIFWYAIQIIIFESLYLHVNNLGGWTIDDIRVFLGILFLIDALQMVLFQHNFDMLQAKVVQGDLELVLLKPVSSLQLMTTQRLQCGYLMNVTFAIGWLCWSLPQLSCGFSFSTLALLFLIIPTGLTVFYSTRLLSVIPALFMSRTEQIIEIYFSFFRLGMKPDWLYNQGLRYFILLVIPVALIASVPARLIVEPFDIWLFLFFLSLSGVYFFLINRLWHWAIKRYCSQ